MPRPKDFSIGETARITGVSQKKLRYWEKRGFILDVKRSICGERSYRRFTKSHVQQIKIIKEYLEEGYTLPAAAGKSVLNPGRRDK